jgi:hypothetical protein
MRGEKEKEEGRGGVGAGSMPLNEGKQVKRGR